MSGGFQRSSLSISEQVTNSTILTPTLRNFNVSRYPSSHWYNQRPSFHPTATFIRWDDGSTPKIIITALCVTCSRWCKLNKWPLCLDVGGGKGMLSDFWLMRENSIITLFLVNPCFHRSPPFLFNHWPWLVHSIPGHFHNTTRHKDQ